MHIIVTLAAGASAAALAGGCGYTGGTPATTTTQPGIVTTTGTPKNNSGVSGPGVDGGARFTVLKITTTPGVGSARPSNGREYIVTFVKVENIGTKTCDAGGAFLNSDVLIDNTGRQDRTDTTAELEIPSEYCSTGNLQPGSWAPLSEAFEVPVGTVPRSVVMHGDTFSPGVMISLVDMALESGDLTGGSAPDSKPTQAK
jgi:hypothetical protein